MTDLISIIITTFNRLTDTDDCIDSIIKNNYPEQELIVVDNNSSDGTADFLEKKYGEKIKLIRSKKNLMAGGGRNLGAKYATGDLLLFIDSDNIIDKRMIAELVLGIKKVKKAGLVGPIMYYFSSPRKIWWAGADINYWTSKTKYLGIGQRDNGQFNNIEKVGHIPNVFLIKKSLFEKIGGIDENYVMHYEESDLAEKIKRLGYLSYRIPTAKTWHKVPQNNENSVRNYGGESLIRVYYTGRNRIVFMRNNAPRLTFIIFIIFFNNIFLIIYIFKFIKNRRTDLASAYLKGFFAGITKK